jgi:hypothetical protein
MWKKSLSTWENLLKVQDSEVLLFIFWEFITCVCQIYIACSSLNTSSTISDSPSILSVTYLTRIPSSSAVLVWGAFRTPFTLFIMFSFHILRLVCLFCTSLMWSSSKSCSIKSMKQFNDQVNSALNSAQCSIQFIISIEITQWKQVLD